MRMESPAKACMMIVNLTVTKCNYPRWNLRGPVLHTHQSEIKAEMSSRFQKSLIQRKP